MVVVLPAPLGPMKPNTSPLSSLIDSDLTANSSPYFFVRSRVSIMSHEQCNRLLNHLTTRMINRQLRSVFTNNGWCLYRTILMPIAADIIRMYQSVDATHQP